MTSENASGINDSGRKLLRLIRPSIVVLCGPAACGKSTFAERHFRPTQVICSDWARARICDDDRDQRFNSQAFSLVHFLVEQRLTVNRLCVVDSTALTTLARKDLLDLAKRFAVPAILILFNVPVETCVERDEKRHRSVGRAVIERQYQTYEQSKTTICQEGFDQVVELQDSDLEKVQIEILFRPMVRPMPHPQRPDTGNASRSERSPQSLRPRPNGSGGGPSVSPVPVGQPNQRTSVRGHAPESKAAPTRVAVVRDPAPADVAAPAVASPQVARTVNPVAPPATVNLPATPSPTVASTEPEPLATPQSVPVAPSSGRS
jgi:predicted kinase